MTIKKRCIYSIFMITVLLIPAVLSGEQENQEDSIQLGGYLQAENRAIAHDEMEYSWHEYRLDLKVMSRPVENLRFFTEFWLRSWGYPAVEQSADLSDKEKTIPTDIELREAYAQISGLFNDTLDLKIGRQRIAWGTGDNLNPTDNLNPDDLEDIWDFGRHLGSDAILAELFPGDFTFTGVFIPVFTPAVLPRGKLSRALSGPVALPVSLILRNYTDKIELPENSVRDSSIGGFKIGSSFFSIDFSISYIYGRDDIPVAEKIILTPTGVPGEVDMEITLVYPRMHIAGVDMAGSFFDIGFWVETAMFLPEEILLKTDLTALGMGITESSGLDNSPYIKYVIGADYTFTNGIYINAQFLHGFVHERGRDELNDYIIFSIEKKFLNETLKLVPLGGGLETGKWKDFKNSNALVAFHEIAWYPVDNAELVIGFRWIDGDDNTTFGRIKDNDEIYFRAKIIY